ncbi:MAG TPA: hypothetical protein VHK47_08690 [Polyangia bacterium]|nr:hypothetical protein [Polyangia bacterium]
MPGGARAQSAIATGLVGDVPPAPAISGVQTGVTIFARESH